MKRLGYHHGNLKQSLIQEATGVIRAGEEPSLRRLAGAVGVSPSAVYRHFADHAALLDAVAASWLQALGEVMLEALRSANGEPLRVVCRTYLYQACDDPHLFRLASGPHGFGRMGGVLGADQDGPLPQQCYRAAAPAPIAELAWIATHGLATLSIDGPYRREDADRLLPLLLKRLSGPGARHAALEEESGAGVDAEQLPEIG